MFPMNSGKQKRKRTKKAYPNKRRFKTLHEEKEKEEL